jgi:putative N6-adenine-specific DNA methylase
MSFFKKDQMLVVACAFGLESLVSDELRKLGIEDVHTENGKIRFRGGEKELALALLWLRTADRIGIEIANFKAESFDELFDQTLCPALGKLAACGRRDAYYRALTQVQAL